MLKVTKTCRYHNHGDSYNLLPCILVTPLLHVANGFRLTPAKDFVDTTVAEARARYNTRGVRIALRLWTFHLGIQFDWSGDPL